MNEPRILVLDIETSPAVVYAWGLWKQDVSIGQIIEPTRVIAFAAKWHGEKKISFFSEYHNGREAMVQAAWDLIDEADIVVHYNGTTFDMPHLLREFKLLHLGPPSPVQEIDLLKTVRRFRLLSNKLDYAGQTFEIGAKVKHEGFPLWAACLAGDQKAWGRMRRYNIGDVRLTDDLYEDLKPYLKGAPHLGVLTGTTDSCPRCGSTDRQKRGPIPVGVSMYQQYRCNNCGSWHRDTKSIPELRMNTRAVQ